MKNENENDGGLRSTTIDDTPSVEHKQSSIYLSYFKNESHLMDRKDFVALIKHTEKLVRKSKEYKAYIARLKNDLGLRRCALYSEIDDSKAKIEMHHGPVFNLFDYCEILLTRMFQKGENVSSLTLFHKVMKEHFRDRIQIVMLSKMAHQAAHPHKKDLKPEFIPMEVAYGDIVGFIKEYGDCFNFTHINKLRKYMIRAEEENKKSSADNIFKETIANWDKMTSTL